MERFCTRALRALGAAVVAEPGGLRADLAETPVALRDRLGGRTRLAARFSPPAPDGMELLTRTHPVVEGLAAHVLDSSLEPLDEPEAVASRCGVMRTHAVTRRTVGLLLRLRFHLQTRRGEAERELLAEDARVLAFAGRPEAPDWLDEPAAEALLAAEPAANLAPDRVRRELERTLKALGALEPALDDLAEVRARELLESHRRVREAAASTGRFSVEPQLPVDVLGVYVFLPVAEAA